MKAWDFFRHGKQLVTTRNASRTLRGGFVSCCCSVVFLPASTTIMVAHSHSSSFYFVDVLSHCAFVSDPDFYIPRD